MEIKRGDWVYGVINLDGEAIPAITIIEVPTIQVLSFERDQIIDTEEDLTELKVIPRKLAYLLLGDEKFALLEERAKTFN